MEDLLVGRAVERVWHLLILLELVEPFQVEHRGALFTIGLFHRALTPAMEDMYEMIASRAANAGLLLPGDFQSVRLVLQTWSDESPLRRELLTALLSDCLALLSDPASTVKAARLLSARRTH